MLAVVQLPYLGPLVLPRTAVRWVSLIAAAIITIRGSLLTRLCRIFRDCYSEAQLVSDRIKIVIATGNDEKVLPLLRDGNDRNLALNDKHIFGEAFVTHCLAKAALSLGAEVDITRSHHELMQLAHDATMIVVEDHFLRQNSLLLDPPFKERIYLLTYWQLSDPKSYGGQLDFDLQRALVPYIYSASSRNTFIGSFVETEIATSERPYQSPRYKGCLWGKNAGQYFHPEIISVADQHGICFYATCEDEILFANVHNLGILRCRDFHALLNSVDYVVGFGHPSAGPTLLEALFFDCLLLCPRAQIPLQLHDNENILFTDDMSPQRLVQTIQKIIRGEIRAVDKAYPATFTFVEMQKRLQALIARQIGVGQGG
jgi:hypothetical protein